MLIVSAQRVLIRVHTKANLCTFDFASSGTFAHISPSGKSCNSRSFGTFFLFCIVACFRIGVPETHVYACLKPKKKSAFINTVHRGSCIPRTQGDSLAPADFARYVADAKSALSKRSGPKKASGVASRAIVRGAWTHRGMVCLLFGGPPKLAAFPLVSLMDHVASIWTAKELLI